MQLRPFEDERPRTVGHVACHDFKGIDIHLDLFALIDGVKVRWRMVPIKHTDDDSVEPAQFRQGGRLDGFQRQASPARLHAEIL
jgi:hypothetical protein